MNACCKFRDARGRFTKAPHGELVVLCLTCGWHRGVQSRDTKKRRPGGSLGRR